MKWPWERLRIANSRLAQAIIDMNGMMTALSLRDQEIAGLKGTLANMTIHCKALEKTQRDMDTPPISAEDLEALLKRHSFINRQNESLIAANFRLEHETGELRERVKALRTGDEKPSPVSLVQGSDR